MGIVTIAILTIITIFANLIITIAIPTTTTVTMNSYNVDGDYSYIFSTKLFICRKENGILGFGWAHELVHGHLSK